MLVGDHHMCRGGITILGGSAGVGKSRAVTALAVAGATGKDWLGQQVHQRFKTMVIQAENGEFRMKGELDDIGTPEGVDLDDWLRVTPPPRCGLDFLNSDFCREVKASIASFQPGVLVIDPWNRVATDDHIRDYRKALDAVMSCLPADTGKAPAVLIVHHLRKKSSNHNKSRGRDVLNELAGSYSIGSAARTAYALEPATPDTEDDRVVLTCCKCNDGETGARTAWHRRNGLFVQVEDFDFEAFDGDGCSQPGITPAHIEAAVGLDRCKRGAAVKRLQDATGMGRTACYDALAKCDQVVEDTEGLIWWKGDA